MGRNADRVLEVIAANPGLTDREIGDRTRIAPRQQVNAICRRLEDQGLITRMRGPSRLVVNLPGGAEPVTPFTLEPGRMAAEPAIQLLVQPQPSQRLALRPFRLSDTLLIVACSARKAGRLALPVQRTIDEALNPEVCLE